MPTNNKRSFIKQTCKHLFLLILLTSISTIGHSNEAKNSFNKTPNSAPQSHLNQKLLDNLALSISARISNMQIIAKSLANDAHIHEWVNNEFTANEEPLLLEKLNFYVSTFNLTSASFADKNTNKYWNHEGFLRVLTPEIDTWYFAYTATQNADLISIYHDMNKKRVDLYVNYQQITGNGLSGVASSFNSFMDKLANNELASKGTLIITDKLGNIKVHPRILAGEKNLKVTDLFNVGDSNTLLRKLSSQTGGAQAGKFLISSLGEVEWYLVFVAD